MVEVAPQAIQSTMEQKLVTSDLSALRTRLGAGLVLAATAGSLATALAKVEKCNADAEAEEQSSMDQLQTKLREHLGTSLIKAAKTGELTTALNHLQLQGHSQSQSQNQNQNQLMLEQKSVAVATPREDS